MVGIGAGSRKEAKEGGGNTRDWVGELNSPRPS